MFHRFKKAITAQLVQGVSPESLALTFSVAIVLGIFPIMGATTIVLFFVAYWLRLNQPIIQILNYGMTPIHLLLLPVFIRCGEWLVGAPSVSINPAVMFELLKNDWEKFFTDYGAAALYGVFAWGLVAPFAGLIIFYSLRPVFEKIQNRFNRLSTKPGDS